MRLSEEGITLLNMDTDVCIVLPDRCIVMKALNVYLGPNFCLRTSRNIRLLEI